LKVWSFEIRKEKEEIEEPNKTLTWTFFTRG
jgi:hypothetical protein